MNTGYSPDHIVGFGKILDLQRTAFLRDGVPPLSLRREDLKKLRKLLLLNRDLIAQTISADFGHRSPHETAIMELLCLIKAIDYLCRNLRSFMQPTRCKVDLTMRQGRARIEYQPLGVIGIISPWNYPVSLAIMPLATAIAAGNRAMIKPSELTPGTSALLAKLLAEVFPMEQIAVVQGDASVGKAFSALAFDHLLFTGSTSVGRHVMKAASENLVPVTLELGGKSPAIVGWDYDIERAAMSIAYGKLSNAGQTCIAPDYVFVPEEKLDNFVTAFEVAVRKLYPDGPTGTDYTSVINEQHYERLQKLIEDARDKGARILQIGVKHTDARLRPHTLSPTLILDVTDTMQIMQNEIFGPVLPVKTYRSIDQVIDYINAKPRPLALYYFSRRNGEDMHKVLSRTTSGNVTINATLTHYAQDDLPFGGVGPSGMGAYHGIEGFRSLSHAKGIFEQGRWNGADMLRAPFGRLADFILRALLR